MERKDESVEQTHFVFWFPWKLLCFKRWNFKTSFECDKKKSNFVKEDKTIVRTVSFNVYRFTDSTVMPKDSRRECELHFYYELITLLLWKDDFTPHYTCKLIRHLVMTIQLLPLPLKKFGKIVNCFHFKETIQVFIDTYIHTYIYIYIYMYISWLQKWTCVM